MTCVGNSAAVINPIVIVHQETSVKLSKRTKLVICWVGAIKLSVRDWDRDVKAGRTGIASWSSSSRMMLGDEP